MAAKSCGRTTVINLVEFYKKRHKEQHNFKKLFFF